jgi:hypothetical protein
MEVPIGNYAATGGVTGAVVIVAYFVYKICVTKKFKSSCCGATVEVRDDSSTPNIVIRSPPEPEPEPKPKEEV